jgi:cytochrome c-type biogenesis protein CcmF
MSDLGAYALRFALLIAAAGLAIAIYAGRSGRSDWLRVADRSVFVLFGLVSFAMAALFTAFATHDYQLVYVASHAARNMALPYRLAALWGGQAGSLLLWLWMLTAYGAACVAFNQRQNRGLMPWVNAVLLANACFFLVLLVAVTNPFEKMPPGAVMSDGTGLNPLLQHPAMMIHPVMLYTGLVGFVIPFAFGFAALVSGELGTAWFRTTRRWTLFPWLFLSIGIMLGGRWAYEVLGWGGYWAWDPVENASFMPWLPATAYLHSVMIQEKRDMLRTWNLLLIGLTYVLCLFGTFLTRSGVVQSVHSFAQTPIFTAVFLGYVLFTAIVFLWALLRRRTELRSGNRIESYVSREASFLLNNWVFIAILGWVFIGTLFPVFTEPFGKRIAMGPAYYESLLGVAGLALLLLLLTGVGPLIAWRRATLHSLRRQFALPSAALLATAALLLVVVGSDLTIYALLAWSLCGFVTASIVQEFYRAIRARTRKGDENALQAFATLMRRNQQRYGGYIVHLGVVIVLMGAAGSVLNEEHLENVKPGDELHIHDYRLRYLTAEALPSKHYGGAVARLALYRGDEPLATMLPEKRLYWMQEQPASIPSIYSTPREDLYVILTSVEPDGSATFKLYRNPLVNWIWGGGLIFIIGTVSIMWPHPKTIAEKPKASPETRTA